MLQLNASTLKAFKTAQNLAEKMGLKIDVMAGPKNPDLEGTRILAIYGPSDELIKFHSLFPVAMSLADRQREKDIEQLWRMFTLAPPNQLEGA